MDETLAEAKTVGEQGGTAIAVYASHRLAASALKEAQRTGDLTGWTVVFQAGLARHNASGGSVRFIGADAGETRLRGMRARVVIAPGAEAELSEGMRAALERVAG